jgi:hypothetical protein
MKTLNLIFTLALTLLLSGVLYSQNITGTLGTGGVYTIRTTSDTLLRISQSTGNVSLFRNMELGGIENSTSTRGVITKNELRFIHNYQAPGTNGLNTFIGLEAGNFTMSGSGTNASFNTGVGYKSLYSLTIGNFNSALGVQSLSYNTTGYDNSAFGESSLYSNTTGFYNSAFGSNSLYSNTTGSYNSAFGNVALYNSTGSYNSAFGHGSLYYNTSGSYNTAIGYLAGSDITIGSNNIAIGYNAQVPTNSANNQIRLGNTNISYAGIQVAWTVTSDRRYKDNITPLGLGLGFISKLNPVSYVRKNDEKGKTEYGLIAQEVEEVLKELGIENHGMLTVTDEGMYELRYNDLIAPMIKAIQELKEENQQLRNEILSVKSLSDEVVKLKEIVNSLNHKDVTFYSKHKKE